MYLRTHCASKTPGTCLFNGTMGSNPSDYYSCHATCTWQKVQLLGTDPIVPFLLSSAGDWDHNSRLPPAPAS